MMVGYAARLAIIVNTTQKAVELGVGDSTLRAELDKAFAAYLTQLDAVIVPDLQPEKCLQAKLTEPLHHRS